MREVFYTMAKDSKSKNTAPALEPGQDVNEVDGEPIFHADEEEGDDNE